MLVSKHTVKNKLGQEVKVVNFVIRVDDLKPTKNPKFVRLTLNEKYTVGISRNGETVSLALNQLINLDKIPTDDKQQVEK